jgi:quercetin dioxygenase-like cupin family protein
VRLGRTALLGVLAGLAVLAPGARAQDPQGVIEERLALDNDSVRVSVLTFPPGSASGRHTGLDPELGIVVEGELILVTNEGREVLRPGAARLLPPLTPHDARNEGDRPVKLWVVLFKKCD